MTSTAAIAEDPPPPVSVGVAEKEHPLLQRHYSTIGIGDVFVDTAVMGRPPTSSREEEEAGTASAPGGGCWWLPRSYLSSSSGTGKSSSRIHKAAVVVPLWEMTGALKTVPEDFVVREIILAPHHDADGSAEEKSGGGGESIDSNRSDVASSSSSTPRTLVADLGLPQLPAPVVPQVEHEEEKQQPTRTGDNSNDEDQKLQTDDRDNPLSHLEAVLGKFSSSLPAKASSDVKEMLEALQNLHRAALDRIRCLEQQARTTAQASVVVPTQEQQEEAEVTKMSALAPAAAPAGAPTGTDGDDDDTVVRFSFLLHAEPDNDSPEQTKRQRGEIHEAIRHAFPLLRSESASEKNGSESGSPSHPQKQSSQQQYDVPVVIDDFFFDLIPYLHAPVEDLPPLYAFCKHGVDHAQRAQRQQQQRGTTAGRRRDGNDNDGECWGPRLRLHPNLPRAQRRPVHHAVDAKTKGLLGTRTVADCPLHNATEKKNQSENCSSIKNATTTAIEVSWTKAAQRRRSKKRKRENNIAPLHTLCVLQKRRREHLVMVKTLTGGLNCRQADIGLAGIKDMHAVSYQFLTLTNVGRRRIEKAAKFLRERGIKIEAIGQVPRALQKGELVGNRFEIIVRNLCRVQLLWDGDSDGSTTTAPKEQFVPADQEHVQQMVDRLRRGGFVNFYGEQRVGVPGPTSMTGVRGFDVGRAMLQQNWSEVVDLILTGRRLVNGVELVGDSVDLFRRTWKETGGDVDATLRDLPQNGSTVPRERTLLKGLKRYGKDNPLLALRCLQRNERMFYLNVVRRSSGHSSAVSFISVSLS